MSDHGGGAQHEQSALGSVALLGDAALPLFAAITILLWDKPEPDGELLGGAELCWIGDGLDNR